MAEKLLNENSIHTIDDRRIYLKPPMGRFEGGSGANSIKLGEKDYAPETNS